MQYPCLKHLKLAVSSLIFTGSTLVGSVMFALAVSVGIRGTKNMFVLMMAGRMLIGAGTGSSISKYPLKDDNDYSFQFSYSITFLY